MKQSQAKEIARSLKESIGEYLSRFSKKRAISRQRMLTRRVVHKANGAGMPTANQLKYIGRILSPKEKKIIKISFAVIVIAGGFLVYNVFFRDPIVVPKVGGEYTEGLVGRPLYINPLLSQTNDVDQDIARLVFNGLVRYDENYQLVPDLAESWEVSEDQKEYTFRLRQGVSWHDGEPFTANDVRFTFQSIQDKDFKSPLNITFSGVRSEIVDEHTVKFVLQEPYSAFLNIMTVGILPQHLWFEVPAINSQLATYNQKPVGTGPYKFKSLVKDRNGNIFSYTFERNPEYHLEPAYIEKVHFKFYPDTVQAVEALKNKQVMGLGFLPKEFLSEASKRDVNIYEINSAQFTAVFFNPNENELLKDDTVREALKLATNKQEVLDEILKGQGEVIHSPILPGYLGFNGEITHEYDPVRAAELLTADGWQLDTLKIESETEEGETEVIEGEEEVLTKDDDQLIVSLTTIDQPDSIKLVDLIKNQWEQIGALVTLNIVPRETFSTQTLRNREYETLVYGGIVGYDVDPFPFWHSSQREFPGVNLANYVNREADALIEEARKLSDLEARAEKYREFQGLVTEDIPAIFLYTPTYSYPVSGQVKGIDISRINLPSDRFWNITDWYIKTRTVIHL